jgi:cysteine desulfurase
MTYPIYLDYHATTPVDSRVMEAMVPWFTTHFGNAASRSHSFGWQADEAVSLARKQMAEVLGIGEKGIFFTSGATEGINLLIKGMAEANGHRCKHLVTFATEHRAVLDTLHWLGTKGYEIEILPVTHAGNIDIDRFSASLRSDTLCAIVMWANNETGVIHDMETIGAICREREIPLISDATQAVGKMAVKPDQNNVDMITWSAHKFYGPKGIGAVYINPAMRIKPAPLLHGGGHERGLRSGTLNVPGIVGMVVELNMAS